MQKAKVKDDIFVGVWVIPYAFHLLFDIFHSCLLRFAF
jgi:hypothetical protein